MWLETLAGTAIAAGALGTGSIAWALQRRNTLYAILQKRLRGLPVFGEKQFAPAARSRRFEFSDRLAVLPKLLEDDAFARLRAAGERMIAAERNYVPSHKKGGTIAYETLIEQAPAIAGLYHSPAMLALASRITGERLMPTPLRDQSSLSLLWYDRPGDHIGWHYDHNFYRGRHFTLLIPLINEGTGADGLSHAELAARVGVEERSIATPPNRLVIFEGAVVRHKVSPVREGERRLVLSMTYCADPRSRWWQGAARRIKDMAFFGPRALWT